MKKILCLCLAAFFVCSLAACGKPNVTPAVSETTDNERVFSDIQTGEQDTKSNKNSFNFDFDNQVIFESDAAKVTATGFSSDDYGLTLDVTVENLTDKDVIISNVAGQSFVNGLVVSPTVFVELKGHKSANETVYIDTEQLRLSGIEKINDIRMNWEMRDTDYNTIAELKDITLKAKDYSDDFEQPFAVGDKVVYDKNDVYVTYLGKTSFQPWDGKSQDCLLFSVENRSDAAITFYCGDAYMNDVKCEFYTMNDVSAAKTKGYVLFYCSSDTGTQTLNGDIEIEFNIYGDAMSDKCDFAVTV